MIFVSGSPSHSLYNYGSQVNGSRRTSSSLNSSPLKSYASSTPSSKYAAPSRGQEFDPRTFTRPPGAKAGAYSLPPEDDDVRIRKSSYHGITVRKLETVIHSILLSITGEK